MSQLMQLQWVLLLGDALDDADGAALGKVLGEVLRAVEGNADG